MNRCSRFVIFCLLGFYSTSAFGWGAEGHRVINMSFTIHFPVDTLWFTRYSKLYSDHASDADHRKSDPNESPRHYLDIDYYPEFRTAWFPQDLDSLKAKYGSSTVYSHGILPWAIKSDYDSLVTFLINNDTADANRVIADLGHYIGDANQPLHCTEHFNRNGIHSIYESDLLYHYLSQIAISADTVHYVSNVLDFVFEVIRNSNSQVQAIFDADDSARTVAGSTTSSLYYEIMWARLGPMMVRELQNASTSLASLVYSASVDAGGKVPSGVHPPVPLSFSISQPYPNPFNPTTSIVVTVTSNSPRADIRIYCMTGSEVRHETSTIHHGRNVIAMNFATFPSGVYLVSINLTGSGTEERRIVKAVLLK